MARKFKGDIQVTNDAQIDGNLSLPSETSSRVLELDGSGDVASSTVTSTELGYLSGVTSAIQTQIDSKAADADVIKKDGSVTYTADQSMGSNKLTNLAAPTGDNDAARKIDVDTAAAGIKVKDPADVVSTANITLSGEQTLDGVLTSASRVLVVAQTSAVDNGIYVSAAGAWARATDFDASPSGEAREGNIVLILQGTDNSDTHYVLNGTNAVDPADIDVGTETNEWVVYSRAEAIQAGAGLAKSSLTLSVDIDGTAEETTNDNADTVLIYDDSASVLKKMSRANFIGAGSTSPGDIEETSFAGANNVSVAANVTGLAFANGVARSFKVHGSIHLDATSDLFEEFELHGIQRAADWVITDTRTGDDSLVDFTITTAGQIQYTSANYTGFVSLDIKFRAVTTSL